MLTGLVSFVVFGDDPSDVYYGGAVKNAILYKNWHPEWVLRFYLGDEVPESLEKELFAANSSVEIKRIHEPENQTSTWWRMRAIGDSNYDFIIFRDVDSRPCDREKDAVEEWLESRFSYHVMRDHQFHGRQLLAGLWGLKREVYHELVGIPFSIGQNEDFYGIDQIALALHVWPHCRRKIMAHIGCYNIFERIDQRRPFRVARDPGSFVAQGLDAKDRIRYPGHEMKVDHDYELLANDMIFLPEYRR